MHQFIPELHSGFRYEIYKGDLYIFAYCERIKEEAKGFLKVQVWIQRTLNSQLFENFNNEVRLINRRNTKPGKFLC